MKRGMFPKAVALALILVLGGCGPKIVEYQPLGRTVETDPATGDTIITQFWKRGDQTTATFKRIPKGNTDRRGEPLPPAGVAD